MEGGKSERNWALITGQEFVLLDAEVVGSHGQSLSRRRAQHQAVLQKNGSWVEEGLWGRFDSGQDTLQRQRQEMGRLEIECRLGTPSP